MGWALSKFFLDFWNFLNFAKPLTYIRTYYNVFSLTPLCLWFFISVSSPSLSLSLPHSISLSLSLSVLLSNQTCLSLAYRSRIYPPKILFQQSTSHMIHPVDVPCQMNVYFITFVHLSCTRVRFTSNFPVFCRLISHDRRSFSRTVTAHSSLHLRHPVQRLRASNGRDRAAWELAKSNLVVYYTRTS